MSVDRRPRATRIASRTGRHAAQPAGGAGTGSRPNRPGAGRGGALGGLFTLVPLFAAGPVLAFEGDLVNSFSVRGGPTVSLSLGGGNRSRAAGAEDLTASPFAFPFAPHGAPFAGDHARTEARFGSTLRIDGRRRWTQIDARAEPPGWGVTPWMGSGTPGGYTGWSLAERPDGGRLGPQFGFGAAGASRIGGRSRFAPGVELGRPELRMLVSHAERIDERTVVVFDVLRHRGVTGGRGNLVSTGLRRRLSPDSSVALAFGVGVGNATEQWRATVAYQLWF